MSFESLNNGFITKFICAFIKLNQIFATDASDNNGIIYSQVFPGLWLDKTALLTGNLAKVLAVLQQGLASRSHQDFVQQLAKK